MGDHEKEIVFVFFLAGGGGAGISIWRETQLVGLLFLPIPLPGVLDF